MVIFLLVDSHCHLDWFKKPRETMEKARARGVTRVLSSATNNASIEKNLSLSKEVEGVLCTIGLHPGEVLKMPDGEIDRGFGLVEKNISEANGVGEVGLDFKYAQATGERRLQEKVFRGFISLAIEHDKPVIVHARYAESRCLDILEEMKARKVLMHWFTNSRKTSSRAVSLGYCISCGPTIFSDEQSAQVVGQIPLSSLLLETDAPVSFSGKQSEPSWIPLVRDRVAEIKGVSSEEVEEAAEKNFNALL